MFAGEQMENSNPVKSESVTELREPETKVESCWVLRFRTGAASAAMTETTEITEIPRHQNRDPEIKDLRA